VSPEIPLDTSISSQLYMLIRGVSSLMDVKLSEEAIWYMIKKCVMMGILQAVSKRAVYY